MGSPRGRSIEFVESSRRIRRLGSRGGDVTLAVDESVARVKYVAAYESALVVTLSDGRKLSLPLAWFPRLKHGTPAERNNWRLIGRGEGVHWPDLDEDLSVEGFLAGRKSSESRESLKKWLAGRDQGRRRKS